MVTLMKVKMNSTEIWIATKDITAETEPGMVSMESLMARL